MQLLYAITVAILAFFFPSVLGATLAEATPGTAVPGCVLPDRVFDSLPGNFTLEVVTSIPSRNPKMFRPIFVRIGTDNLKSPVQGPPKGEGSGFQLINKIFSTTLGPKASILTNIFGTEGVDFSQITYPGLQSVVFDPDTRRPPSNFTATTACDNDSKFYLRLLVNNGECFSVGCWKMRGDMTTLEGLFWF